MLEACLWDRGLLAEAPTCHSARGPQAERKASVPFGLEPGPSNRRSLLSRAAASVQQRSSSHSSWNFSPASLAWSGTLLLSRRRFSPWPLQFFQDSPIPSAADPVGP